MGISLTKYMLAVGGVDVPEKFNGTLTELEAIINGGTIRQAIEGSVLDRGINTPPASPASSDSYIVGTSPTGAWIGQANKIAYWLESVLAWQFIAPRAGWTVWVVDEATYYRWTGSAWVMTNIQGFNQALNTTSDVAFNSGSIGDWLAVAGPTFLSALTVSGSAAIKTSTSENTTAVSTGIYSAHYHALEVLPGAPSSGIYLGRRDEIRHKAGSYPISGGGHSVAQLGHVIIDSGVTVGLAIGQEAKLDNDGTATLATLNNAQLSRNVGSIGTLFHYYAQVSNNASSIGLECGFGFQVNQNTGNIPNAAAFYAGPVENTGGGTIGTFYGLFFGDQSGKNIGTRWAVYNVDPGAGIYSAGPAIFASCTVDGQQAASTFKAQGAVPSFNLLEPSSNTAARAMMLGGVMYIEAGAPGGGEAVGTGHVRISGYGGADIGAFQVRRAGDWYAAWDAATAPEATLAEAQAGVSTSPKMWTPSRLREAIQALGGSAITSGSNANGTWIRFPDGTQICHHRLQVQNTGTTWTFPAVFSSAPHVSTGGAQSGANYNGAPSASSASLISTGSVDLTLTAFGKWF